MCFRCWHFYGTLWFQILKMWPAVRWLEIEKVIEIINSYICNTGHGARLSFDLEQALRQTVPSLHSVQNRYGNLDFSALHENLWKLLFIIVSTVYTIWNLSFMTTDAVQETCTFLISARLCVLKNEKLYSTLNSETISGRWFPKHGRL